MRVHRGDNAEKCSPGGDVARWNVFQVMAMGSGARGALGSNHAERRMAVNPGGVDLLSGAGTKVMANGIALGSFCAFESPGVEAARPVITFDVVGAETRDIRL